MQIRYLPDSVRAASLDTAGLRRTFLIESLFHNDAIELVYCDVDRAIVGSAVPVNAPLELSAAAELRAEFFAQRRELGVLNIGGAGRVEVDGVGFPMAALDCLYVARGSRRVTFHSVDPASPAQFYLLSYPAHAVYPTTLASKAQAAAVQLGNEADCNRRTIYKYIHADGIRSCQLVMGFTQLATGSVWNTMPAHTHARRSEVYFYFNLSPAARVFHLMGEPTETRHVVVADKQAVISPSWSIHSGCGTSNYAFCWGMGGENQAFDDMDLLTVSQLR
jgi:4-deoxy-L-threo-5-hexosulose-uronate ketol-isomerase